MAATLGPWETQTVDTASLPPTNPAGIDFSDLVPNGAATKTPIGGLLMKATASSNGLQGLSGDELNSLSAHFGRSINPNDGGELTRRNPQQ